MSERCLLCDSDRLELLYNKGRGNKKVDNYICSNCGFVFILPRLSSQKIAATYKEGEFSRLARKLSSPDNNKFSQCENLARPRLKILEDFIGSPLYKNHSQKSCLEIGCGTGSFLRLMRACGWHTLGLEPDSAYTRAVAERYNLHIENVLLEDFFPSNNFDLIVSFHVIEHINEPNSFLKVAYDLLSPDGYFFIECPSIDRWYGDSIDFFFWDVHINTFTQKTLIAFLAKAGFKVVSYGWNGNGLWAIAKKTNYKISPVVWDDSIRVKYIVQTALRKSKVYPNQRSKRLNRLASLTRQGLILAQKSPRQIPSKILAKAKNRLGLAQNPLDAQNIGLKPNSFNLKPLKIAHVGLHSNGNAGDTLLFPAVRWLFQQEVSPINFSLIPLRDPVTHETIDTINQQDALIVGGGGLFLSDSNPNNRSGWQWACPLDLLEKIKVPIVVFAVGYNRFRGQEEFAPVFRENLQRLVEKSVFFGIRNRGSIEAVKNYIPNHLHDKIYYQPCPTTVLKHFYPNLPQYSPKENPVLAVNIAFDRHHLRFGKREDEILWSMADAFLLLEQQGWNIKLFNHTPADGDAQFWFKSRGLFAEEINLAGVPPKTILEEYCQATIALGMRGHAQMVPFGLHRPIYSLVSHDKLQFFLDDISHPDWGIEVKDPDLSDKLVHDLQEFYTNLSKVEAEVKADQNELWNITLRNLDIIKKALKV